MGIRTRKGEAFSFIIEHLSSIIGDIDREE